MASESGESLEKLEDMIVRAAESTAAHVRAAKAAISSVIFGQDIVVERALVTVLSGGHALLVGVPGLAKTKLVETMGIALGLDAKRVQFTPDLMPSDILGTEVLEETPGGKRSFRFIAGPVFAQLLMADEINRASPRTQSALLQAMQEQHVTVAGARHDLPKPFHVLATQNPLEQEGTYPLPEAQLDRFLMEVDVDYPDLQAERKILFDTTGAEETRAKAAMTSEDLIAAQRLVRRLPVGESVVEAILTLVRSARPGPEAGDLGRLISWGPGPRASQALMLAVRARALLEGRFAPSVDDVLELAEPVLKHRMALTFAARAEGETIVNVIKRLKARIGSSWPSPAGAIRRTKRYWRLSAKAESSPRAFRDSFWKRAASPRLSFTACMDGAAPERARISGNTAASCRASHRITSTGGARRATIISMCANANGKPRIRSGCGPTGRLRWTSRPRSR